MSVDCWDLCYFIQKKIHTKHCYKIKTNKFFDTFTEFYLKNLFVKIHHAKQTF